MFANVNAAAPPTRNSGLMSIFLLFLWIFFVYPILAFIFYNYMTSCLCSCLVIAHSWPPSAAHPQHTGSWLLLLSVWFSCWFRSAVIFQFCHLFCLPFSGLWFLDLVWKENDSAVRNRCLKTKGGNAFSHETVFETKLCSKITSLV